MGAARFCAPYTVSEALRGRIAARRLPFETLPIVKWKLFWRNLSVSAPRMTVRSRLPWPVRMLLGFVFVAAAAAAGVGLYEYGRDWTGPGRRELAAELESAKAQLSDLRAQRDKYAASAATFENQIKIEHAAQKELAQQVSQLEADRNRLRDDLAFFESLLPTKPGAHGIVIRSFRMQPDDLPGQMRYRLLVQQPGRPEKDFVGSVQMQVNLTVGGRPVVLHLPDPADTDMAKSLELSFRHYQRVEGAFPLPDGAVAKSVLVRIVASGKTQAQQSFQL